MREKKNKEKNEKKGGEVSRDSKWSSERSTHLQAKVEFGTLDAFDT